MMTHDDYLLASPTEPKTKTCEQCGGHGYFVFSCCGDDIRGNDMDFCPTCKEHCDMDTQDECSLCEGTGEVVDED